MTVMNRSLNPRQLQRCLNTIFGMEYKRYPEQWRRAFEVKQSDQAFEVNVLQVGLGPGVTKEEGAGGTYDYGAEAWAARAVHETIQLQFAITEEAIEDGLYGNLAAQYSRSMARSMQHTKEIKGAAILNNAFDATNYPIGDGAALCSTAHPLWIGGTSANTLTTQADLAEASLEDALINISTMVDDRNIPVAATAMELIIPPHLGFVAERLTASQLRPGTPDNDVNASRSRGMLPGGYTVMQRLTDTNGWFIKTDVPDSLVHYQRIAMKKGMEGDFESGNLRYKARERYSFVVLNWRGIFGCQGA